MEVEQQSNFNLRKPQIRKQLGFVDPLNALDAFQLNDDKAFHEDIDAISAIKFRTL